MARLNIERQEKLEPERMAYAIEQLINLGIDCGADIKTNCIEFYFKDKKVTFWPYSGYFNGKSVKAGRGIKNLLDQIKQ